MRPRGWHLAEKHMRFHDRRAARCTPRARSSTSGCTSSTTRRQLIAAGAGPYFYLPKLESHREARLWNDVFTFSAQDARHPARHDPGDRADRDAARPRSRWTRSSTSCATTAPGLNAGRWDYIFSIIKNVPRRAAPTACCPTAAQITMTVPFMRAYTELLVADLPPARRASRSAA